MKKNKIMSVLAVGLVGALDASGGCWENFPAQCFAKTISCIYGSCVASGTTYNAVRTKTGNVVNTGDTLTSGWSLCVYDCPVYWGWFRCDAHDEVDIGVTIATGNVC